MRFDALQNFIDVLRGKRKCFAKIAKENNIQIPKKFLKKVKLNIEGKNNTIIIDEIKGKKSKLIINIYGDNNTVKIAKGFRLSNKLELLIGQNHPNFGKVMNSSFTIDENTSMELANYLTFNSNTYCKIGKNCMFSFDIVLYNTDGHPVLDKDTNEVINYVKGITIGDHCWIGKSATILKNSFVPNDCIVGMNAVYSGNPEKEGKSLAHCVFAGNPARLVKQNVTWDSNGRKYGYIENAKEV